MSFLDRFRTPSAAEVEEIKDMARELAGQIDGLSEKIDDLISKVGDQVSDLTCALDNHVEEMIDDLISKVVDQVSDLTCALDNHVEEMTDRLKEIERTVDRTDDNIDGIKAAVERG